MGSQTSDSGIGIEVLNPGYVFSVGNSIDLAQNAILGGVYQNNLATECPGGFADGTDAGGNTNVVPANGNGVNDPRTAAMQALAQRLRRK